MGHKSRLLVIRKYCTTGGLIGNLPTEQCGISGQFYIINSKTLFTENFNYDGLGLATLETEAEREKERKRAREEREIFMINCSCFSIPYMF